MTTLIALPQIKLKKPQKIQSYSFKFRIFVLVSSYGVVFSMETQNSLKPKKEAKFILHV